MDNSLISLLYYLSNCLFIRSLVLKFLSWSASLLGCKVCEVRILIHKSAFLWKSLPGFFYPISLLVLQEESKEQRRCIEKKVKTKQNNTTTILLGEKSSENTTKGIRGDGKCSRYSEFEPEVTIRINIFWGWRASTWGRLALHTAGPGLVQYGPMIQHPIWFQGSTKSDL